jgi:peptide/nickel transport system substrate-binding protein
MENRKLVSRVLCLALAFVMASSLVACTKESPPAAQTPPPSTYKDTLTVAVASDMTSMDPHVGKEIAAVVVTNNIFATLVSLTPEGEVAPYIAESWTQVDEKTFDFTIRKDIKWHDGSVLTPDDVVFSLNRAINSPYVSYIVNYIEKVEKVGELVRVTLKAPYVGALINLAIPFAAIVPQKVVEDDPDGFVMNPIGCGPYKFVEWQQGNYVKITRFDDYFLGPAKTKDIIFRIIPEATQRTIALENGEVDLVYDLPVNDLARVEDDPNLQLFSNPSLTTWYVSMNVEDPILSNKKVRQAIRYAVDTQAIIDSVLYGAGAPANSIVPPAARGYVKDAPYYKQDIEKAKQLLAEAGYPNGIKLKLAVAEDVTRVAVCQILQDQLKQANIDVEINLFDASTYYTHANRKEFQLAFYFWICSAGHADYQYYSLLHSSQHGAGGNRSFFSNPEADRLIEEGRSTIVLEENLAAYTALERILDEEVPNLLVCYVNMNVGASAKVDGFVMHPAGYHNLETVAIKQ